jgi:hypothetical protein
MVPQSDPKKHIAAVSTPKVEITTVGVKDIGEAIKESKELVKKI